MIRSLGDGRGLRWSSPFVNQINDIVARNAEFQTGHTEWRAMRRFRAQHEQLAITPSNADRAIAARPIEQGGKLPPRF